MNTHKHARLTFARRLEMVKDLTEGGLSTTDAALKHGVTAPTVRKWLGRYLVGGEAALGDASSRPARSPKAIEPGKALLIVELRKRRMIQSRIARTAGVSESTVSRVLARAGLSKLSDLQPVEPAVRYEHDAPGDLLHHRHQEARTHRSTRPTRHRQTQRRRSRCWLGDAVHCDRRSLAPGVHGHACQRAKGSGGGVLDERRCLLRQARNHRQAPAHGQRLGVSIKRVRSSLPSPWHHAQIHSALPTTNQRQGRSDSSSRRFANGRTAGRSRTRSIEPKPSPAGSTTTTAIDLTAASATFRRSPRLSSSRNNLLTLHS